MSIIYDALKKLDKNKDKNKGTNLSQNLETANKTSGNDPKKIILYILVVVIGIVIGKTIFGSLTRPKASDAVVKSTPQAPPAPVALTVAKVIPKEEAVQTAPAAPSSPYSLNGVFYSEIDAYALINNQVVKVGDEIDGAVVKNISLDEVELETPTSTIRLNSRTK